MEQGGINRKEFQIGDVAYYVENDKTKPNTYHVAFGIVEEHYTYEVCLQLYEVIDTRTINGIPVKEFETPTKWQKLPKGWTYSTQLIEYGHMDIPNKQVDYKINNPADILKAIEDGVLVKVQDNDHAHFETQIDTKEGYRIVRNYPWHEYHPWHVSVNFREIYKTYEEAQAVIDAKYEELQSLANLSDYDWSVEHIDKDINKGVRMGYFTEEEGKKFRDRLLALDRVEDIETRLTNNSGGIEWKYWKNKRWNKLV